jgi:hypothetical protein
MISAIAEDYRRDLAGFYFIFYAGHGWKSIKLIEPCSWVLSYDCLTGHVILLDPFICQNKFVIKSYKFVSSICSSIS